MGDGYRMASVLDLDCAEETGAKEVLTFIHSCIYEFILSFVHSSYLIIIIVIIIIIIIIIEQI